MTEFILPLITSIVGAFVTWFFARKKSNAEAKAIEIDNDFKTVEYYENLLNKQSARLEQAIETIEKQDAKIKNLIQEVEWLTDELKKYKQLRSIK